MDSKTVAVDLAKDAFELAVADVHARIVERHRISRRQLQRFLANHLATS